MSLHSSLPTRPMAHVRSRRKPGSGCVSHIMSMSYPTGLISPGSKCTPKIIWARAAAEILLNVRENYPVSLHATGLSLGSVDGVDAAHLAAIAELCRRIEPAWCRTICPGAPFPAFICPICCRCLTRGGAEHIRAQYRSRAGRAAARDPDRESVCLSCLRGTRYGEGEFLAALVRRTGCRRASGRQQCRSLRRQPGIDARDWLDACAVGGAARAIGEIHLAGHAQKHLPDGGKVRIDDHGSPVSDAVWSLYETAIQAIGPGHR